MALRWGQRGGHGNERYGDRREPNYAAVRADGGTAHVLKAVYAQGAESVGAMAVQGGSITVGSGTATGSVTAAGRGVQARSGSNVVV